MALDLYRAAVGFSIDEEDGTRAGSILSGTGAPGGDTSFQDDAPIGSIYLRTDASSTISVVYQKITDTNATADWVQSASKDYVQSVVSGLSWREPVLVRDGTAYADVTAAETAANVGDTVDGVTIAADDRLLFTNIAYLETIAAQDETDFTGAGDNGSFVGGDGAGGTAYVAADTITLSDGTVITVDAVDGNGDVTQFTVTTNSTSAFSRGETLTQASTSGTGTSFTLTPGDNNTASTTPAPADANNVYIVSGSSGNWTFTESDNAESDGDALLVQEGTSADQQWVYDGDKWVLFGSATSAAELGFIRAFIGKTAAGAETPTYSSAVVVTQNGTLEAAIGELDAAIGDRTYTAQNIVTDAETITASLDAIDLAIGDRTYTEQNFVTDGESITASLDALDQAVADNAPNTAVATGVTAATTVDTVLVDDIQTVKWFVTVFDEGDPTQKESVEIYATHDGTGAADATEADYNISSKLRLNGSIIGLDFDVVFTGTGAAQTMGLQVTSTDTVTINSTRIDVEI